LELFWCEDKEATQYLLLHWYYFVSLHFTRGGPLATVVAKDGWEQKETKLKKSGKRGSCEIFGTKEDFLKGDIETLFSSIKNLCLLVMGVKLMIKNKSDDGKYLLRICY
jgi:hypothetical protein